MTGRKRLETFLPGFGGFYRTKWEDLLSSTEEIYATMEAQAENENIGLVVDDLIELLSEAGNVSRHCTSLARCYCDEFDERMSKKLGFPMGLKFSKLNSPSEYNFRTDRILAKQPLGSARKLFSLSEAEKHENLEETIRDWFTPYPGFIPYYSNDIDPWLAKPVDSWDCNELCVLLDAFTDPDIDDELFSVIAGGGGASMAFECSVDWKGFEKKAVALRRKKTKAFLDSLVFDSEVP